MSNLIVGYKGNFAEVDDDGQLKVAHGGSLSTVTVTLSTGATGLSDAVDIGGMQLMGVMMSTAWTAANLTFQASNSSAGTFADVYDDAGTEVTVTAAASRAIAIDFASLKLAPWRYLKVRSGTTALPVAQVGAKTLTLIGKV